MKNEDDKYATNLLDIVRGYSVLTKSGKSFYFKHFKVVDLLELDYLQEIDIAESKKIGIKKQEDLLDIAIKRKVWSVAKEEEIKSLGWILKKSIVALDKITDPFQRKNFNAQIENQENDLKKLEEEKAKICSYSAEGLSEVKKIKRMEEKALFLDKDLTQQKLDNEDISVTRGLFDKYQELNNRNNILRASYFGGFFDLFTAQNGNSIQLLGDKSFCDITSFQKSLLVLSNALLNKLKNTKMPDEIYGDPVKMLSYEEKEEGEKKVSHGVDDLRAKSKARGGKLKPEDFLS